MTVATLSGLVAAIVAIVALIGGIMTRDRFILNTIKLGDEALRKELDTKAANLHERVNRTRDEFVRREDLDKHLTRLELSMSNVYSEVKETNKRMDQVLLELSKNATNNNERNRNRE